MRDRDLAEVYALLRTGELDLVYAREEIKGGQTFIYCTMKPRQPVLPNVTDRLVIRRALSAAKEDQ